MAKPKGHSWKYSKYNKRRKFKPFSKQSLTSPGSRMHVNSSAMGYRARAQLVGSILDPRKYGVPGERLDPDNYVMAREENLPPRIVALRKSMVLWQSDRRQGLMDYNFVTLRETDTEQILCLFSGRSFFVVRCAGGTIYRSIEYTDYERVQLELSRNRIVYVEFVDVKNT